MEFNVVKSEALKHLNSLEESGSAILLVMNESGDGYTTYNINISKGNRAKMLMQESVNILKEDKDNE